MLLQPSENNGEKTTGRQIHVTSCFYQKLKLARVRAIILPSDVDIFTYCYLLSKCRGRKGGILQVPVGVIETLTVFSQPLVLTHTKKTSFLDPSDGQLQELPALVRQIFDHIFMSWYLQEKTSQPRNGLAGDLCYLLQEDVFTAASD